MNSKRIGNIAEAKVISRFVELGYPVLLPFGDNEKYDLVVDMNGFKRVQVKNARLKDGYLSISTSISYNHRKRGRVLYSKEDIDYFAFYSSDLDQTYLILIEEAEQAAINLRIEEAKNGQSKGVRYAKDYIL